MTEWSARALPRLRRDLADAYEATADRVGALVARAPMSSLTASASELVEHHQVLARLTRGAELYWVTADMGALALDASHDVPGFTMADLPGTNGLVAFGAPLPALQTPPLWLEGGTPWQGALPVWALAWHWRTGGREVAVDIIARKGDLPTPMMGGSELQPVFSAVIPAGGHMIFDEVAGVLFNPGPVGGVLDHHPEPMGREHLGVLAFLSAMSHLMMEPHVATRKTLDARTGKGERDTSRPSDLVSVIDLRPLRYQRTPDAGEGGRTYAHRWIVRGHWAQQAHGPDRSLRKLIYRAPYVKGPEGAPFLTTEKVMVWRR